MQINNPFSFLQKTHQYIVMYVVILVAFSLLLVAIAIPTYLIKIHNAEQQVEALQHRNRLLMHRKALQEAEVILFGGSALRENTE